MKAQALKEAIDFAMSIEEVKAHISALEAEPKRFMVSQITATVANLNMNIIRVFLNYWESGNPNLYKEDAIIDLQGTSITNFEILNIIAYQANP
jgi:hypothetical protein